MNKFAGFGAALIVAALLFCAPVMSRADGYLYANAKVAAQAHPTYAWVNTYEYRGQVGGEFYLGDTDGVNFLQGMPLILTFPSASVAHVEGVGLWNGQAATFSADFDGEAAVSWSVKVGSVTVWSGSSGYEWVGIYKG